MIRLSVGRGIARAALALLLFASPLLAREDVVRRSRLLIVDPERVTRVTEPGDALWLHLFSDASFTAVLDRLEADRHNGVVWQGHLRGVHDSTVLLVVEGDVMAGIVWSPESSYRIRYAGSGMHVIEELEERDLQLQELADDAVAVDWAPARPGKLPSHKIRRPASPMSTFDLLVLYTPAAESWAGGRDGIRSRIRLHTAVANNALANGKAKARFRLVRMARVAYEEGESVFQDLQRLRQQRDGFLKAGHRQRRRFGADFVSLYRFRSLTDRPCGVALQGWNQGIEEPDMRAFNVVQVNCRAKTLAHELGHNMGLLHAREDYSNPELMESLAAFRYSFGFKNREPGNRFYTVMAYPCGGCRRAIYFSNPKVRLDGSPTGVRRNQPDAAHAVRSINRIRDELAAYRPCKVDCD